MHARHVSALVGRLFRPRRLRPSRRASAPPPEAALERLESRALLAAGASMWSQNPDLMESADDGFEAVAVQADGKIVAVGTQDFLGDDDIVVARFTAGGRLDGSFGFGGVKSISFAAGGDDRGYAVAIEADGKILVGGTTVTGGKPAMALVRLNRDGSEDTSFADAGRLVQAYQKNGVVASTFVTGLAVTTGGKILVAGGFNNADGFVRQVHPSGFVDGSYGASDGMVIFSGSGDFMDVAVDSKGRAVAVSRLGKVVRLLSNGAADPSFNGGIASFGFDVGTTAVGEGVVIDGLDRVVLAGHSYDGSHYVPGVARLVSSGGYDSTFGGNGRTSFDVTAGVSDYLRDVAVLPNGAVVVVGETNASSGNWIVAALTPLGNLDSRLDTDGILTTTRGASDSASGVAVTADGHYVVVGRVSFSADDDTASIAQFQGCYPRRDDLLGWTNGNELWAAASDGSKFVNVAQGQWNRNGGWTVVDMADFNGDGASDLAGRDGTGQWWIGFSGLGTTASARWNEAAGWKDVRFADFNGDGKADIAARTSYGQWWVSLSTGLGLANGVLWDAWAEAAQWRDVVAADFDGDGRADLAGRTYYGEWWVSKSNGTRFVQSRWDQWNEAARWRDVRAGDFDGDGRADLAGRTYYGEWWVSRSTGAKFNQARWGAWAEAADWKYVHVGDFNGDGRLDLVGRAATGECFVGLSTGAKFTTSRWDIWTEAAQWRDVRIGDFDGDGKDDIAGRTYYGEWWVSKSTGAKFNQARWGAWAEAAGWTTFRGEIVLTLS